ETTVRWLAIVGQIVHGPPASPILTPSEAAATGMSSDVPNPVDPRVREAELNHRLLLDPGGRQLAPAAGSRWCERILPAAGESHGASSDGLRLVMFASYEFGYLALETVKAYARRFPGRVKLVGLATDDPMNTEARIGLKKRVRKHVSREEVVAIETAVVEAALDVGTHASTRQLKTPSFRALP